MNYDNYEILCVLDTNVFLENKFFVQVEWEKILNTKKFVIIVPKTVQNELDNHKTNPNKSKRARQVIKKFREIEISKNFPIDFLNFYPDWKKIEKKLPVKDKINFKQLQPVKNDNMIIGEILQLINDFPNKKIILVSGDWGISRSAKLFYIEVIDSNIIEYLKKEELKTDKKSSQTSKVSNNDEIFVQLLFDNIVKTIEKLYTGIGDYQISKEKLHQYKEYMKYLGIVLTGAYLSIEILDKYILKLDMSYRPWFSINDHLPPLGILKEQKSMMEKSGLNEMWWATYEDQILRECSDLENLFLDPKKRMQVYQEILNFVKNNFPKFKLKIPIIPMKSENEELEKIIRNIHESFESNNPEYLLEILKNPEKKFLLTKYNLLSQIPKSKKYYSNNEILEYSLGKITFTIQNNAIWLFDKKIKKCWHFEKPKENEEIKKHLLKKFTEYENKLSN